MRRVIWLWCETSLKGEQGMAVLHHFAKLTSLVFGRQRSAGDRCLTRLPLHGGYSAADDAGEGNK